MATLFEYLDWRGDVPFNAVPFNEVDALLLCQLAYLDYSGLVGDSFSARVPLSAAADSFFTADDYTRRAELGLLINPQTVSLLRAAGASVRFGSVRMCAFRAVIDHEAEEQFCAVTYILEDGSRRRRLPGGVKPRVFVSFRGTDDTIVGWKEDFNLAFMSPVPAQKDAAEYAQQAASVFSRSALCFGGHSKGGNLALYAAMCAPASARKRLSDVYNFDGPGLTVRQTALPEYKAVAPVFRSFFPRFSVVGMLFEHAESFTAVQSTESGLMQHDPLSWQVRRTSFETLPELDRGSWYIDRTVNGWMNSLPQEQVRQFVDVLFSLLTAADARTNSDLAKDWLGSSAAILKAFTALPSESRDLLLDVTGRLISLGWKNLHLLHLLPE